MPDPTTITGIVQKIYFQNADRSFSIGGIELADSKEYVNFVGSVHVGIGDTVTFVGAWVIHPKYGRQFKIGSAIRQEKLELEGLAPWLVANAEGIGDVRAKYVVEHLGAEFENTLLNETDHFALVARITPEQAGLLKQTWMIRGDQIKVSTQLAAFGLTNHQVTALVSKYGVYAAEIVTKNPYVILHRIKNFGWQRVDEIALKLGIQRNDPNRLAEGIRQALFKATENGSTCRGRKDLLAEAIELLTMDEYDAQATITDRLDRLIDEPEGRVDQFGIEDKQYYALRHLARAEKATFRFLKFGWAPNPHIGTNVATKLVDIFSNVKFRNGKEFVLDDSQKRALEMVATQRHCIISGQAGAGKTLLIKAIYEMLTVGQELNVRLAAPTGKAARRMEEVVGAESETIHRLLDYSPVDGFRTNRNKPLTCDVVIVDECSMIGVDLMEHLIDAIDMRTCLVMIGDHHQLPSISPGAILRDCLEHKIAPFHVLTQCHRQAGLLKTNCSAILNGVVAPSEPPAQNKVGPPAWLVHRKLDRADEVLKAIEKLYTTLLPQWCFDPLRHVQFLTPMHKGPLGTMAINKLLQKLHQKTLGFEVPDVDADSAKMKMYVGDKVIQTVNNYEINIMNGTVGVVKETDLEDEERKGEILIDFDGREIYYNRDMQGELKLAYCLTPHKFQGSQTPCAITVCHSSHAFMLNRNWLYTSCTRAQTTSIILGNETGIRAAAARREIDSRETLMPVLVEQNELETAEVL